jgi:tetratricopeptide (TPR) repeat protein
MAQDTEKTSAEERVKGPELRLLDRRAYVGFPELKLAPGVLIKDFALQIPDVTFPFNVTGGASRYQKKKLEFGYLEVIVDAEVITRALASVAGKLDQLEDLKLHFRPGYLEVQARLRGPERAPLTFKVAFDGDGDQLAVFVYDVRFYAFSTTPASRLPALISSALAAQGLLPDVKRRGANGFSTRVLPGLVEAAAVGRGFKMPALDQARLSEAHVSGKGIRLRFAAGGLPPPTAPDEELLLALEGARAFADAEELLAEGKLAEAREAYLRLGDATEAHPFAAERLLTLLVADPAAQELALDVASSLARRREKSATALWAEGVVRERRGEFARAAERFLSLSNLARKNQEEAGAFFAAEAGARAARDQAPQMAVKALHEVLGVRPDHLPSLKALARASDIANDRAGAIRAYRRLAALARDPAEAAEAHVQLARLCAQTEDDLAGARLHCEAALRLSPDHPDALLQLGELCLKAGEHLRAIKALDRLREVAMGRHEVDRIGRANILAGEVWEFGLKQPENALLRYREAVSLLPGEAEPHFKAARVAESLGKLQEALAGYQQAIELAGPAPRNEEVRKAAHGAHHALARLFKNKLGEPVRAREHLESALALDPRDAIALDELLPAYRAQGKAAELADACEKAAAVLDDGPRRAALWAEAGELYRGRLAQPDRAERLLTQALDADPKNRLALEGMLALAESKRDGATLCRCLRELAQLTVEAKDKVRFLRRLAVAARDLSFDADLAAWAYREVLKVEQDDLPVLGELCALERRRGDMPGLAWALEQRARAAEVHADKRLSAAALRELAQVLEVRLGRAGEALVALEKAARLFPDANVLLDLATLSLRCERPGAARKALEDVLALLPKHAAPERLAEVRARLGRACDLLGDKEAAKEQYALAFPLRRLDDELCGRLEALYEESGQQRELVEVWSTRAQALLQAGRPLEAAPFFFRAAQALLTQGDFASALLKLQAALDAAPQGDRAPDVLEAMADLQLKRGETLEAARLFARRAGLEKDARDGARMYFRAAQLAKGTPREEQFLQQSLETDQSFVPARLRRAELKTLDDPRAALVDFEAVLDADPKDPDTQAAGMDRTALTRRAGMAALQADQPESARRLLALYSAHRPDDVEAAIELAHLHRKSGSVEALVDLLGELWPRLEGAGRRAARREFAEGALSLGRGEASTEALRAILVDEPGDVWAAQKLLGLLPADAATALERQALITRLVDAAQGDDKAELLARRAELWQASGNLGSARTDLLDAAQLATQPRALLRALAELARQANDFSGELEAWKLTLQRLPDDQQLAHDAADRLLALAKSREDARDPDHARAAWQMAVTLPLSSADRFDAFAGVARVSRSTGDFAAAEQALLEASRQGPVPRRVDALMERAALLEARGALDGAVESFGAALALAPRHPDATTGLRRCLAAQGDWAGLAELLAAEAAHAPKGKALGLWQELANLYLEKLNLPGPGEAALRRVATLDEKDVGVRKRLAGLLARKGEVLEATGLYEEAAAHVDANEGAALLREGARLAEAAQDTARALRLLRRGHALVAAEGEDLEHFARVLYLQGAFAEALPLQQLVARAASFDEDPDSAEGAWLRLADLATEVADPKVAEDALRRVVRERPLNTAAVERLAVLIARKDPREALTLLARHAESLSPSARNAGRLLELARRAAKELADQDQAVRLYQASAKQADDALPIRRELCDFLRENGRTADLMGELLEVAQLTLTAGDVPATVVAWEEESKLAEGAGRVDEALRTMQAIAELAEEEDLVEKAAWAQRRRAELLRDARLDLEGAHEALEHAWRLVPDADTARAGMELARRRGDHDSEIDWLERTLDSHKDSAGRAAAFVQLARLHLGLHADGQTIADAPMLAPEQAEAALKQAMLLAPGFAPARELLLGLLERQERMAEVAAFWEESAARAGSPHERSELLLRAATIYKDRARLPHEAAAALLAARAARPDDALLTARVADLLHELGRGTEAADFDAILLEADPFHSAFERHRNFLNKSRDAMGLAALLSRRAELETGGIAAARWLDAADTFRAAGAEERARLCEQQAFDSDPQSDTAFHALMARAEGDVRRKAELMVLRGRAIPQEALDLLRQRARLLTEAGEEILAAGAWEDVLHQSGADLEALEQRAELAHRGGGARAAQPWDRRLLQSGGDTVPAPLRLKTWMRLGLAALEAQAFTDAADAFEAAFKLDPDGPRGREALSLLSEVHSRTQDVTGLYGVTLRLAQRAVGAEQEALWRRAANLYDEPSSALEALLPLAKARPADADIYARTARGLTGAGRLGELLELHERHAKGVGGLPAAKVLLEAARVASKELQDDEKAWELKQAALAAAPSDEGVIKEVLAEQRRRRDSAGVEASLDTLWHGSHDGDARARYALELAQLKSTRGDNAGARAVLEALVEGGPRQAGYSEGLHALEQLLRAQGDARGLAEVLSRRAELLSSDARNEALLASARAWQEAEDPARAIELVKQALAQRATDDAFLLLAELSAATGQHAQAATALSQSAGLVRGAERQTRLLRAVEAWEQAGDRDAALAGLGKLAPGALVPLELAARFTRLNAHDRALDAGFRPALEAAEFEQALRLAKSAGDEEKVDEVLWARLSTGADDEAARGLEERLGARKDTRSLWRLAERLEEVGRDDDAARLWLQRLQEGDAAALGRLLAKKRAAAAAQAVLELGRADLLEALLADEEALDGATREELYLKAADAVPAKARGLLAKLSRRYLQSGRNHEAAETLARLALLEEDVRARAALHLERGELLLNQLNRPDEAKVAFERALADDADSVVAVRHLAALALGQDADKFVAMAERLQALAGAPSIAGWHLPLADAYEALGRLKDAYRHLEPLPESSELIARRAALAEKLGLTGEALALQEKIAADDGERARILEGYLRSDLVPFAVRLGAALLKKKALSPPQKRLLAERLSNTEQGAELAATVWPALLEPNPLDADGWTLFAEALRRLERTQAAELADGFGEAVVGGSTTAKQVPHAKLSAVAKKGLPPLPEGVVAIDEGTMPRLSGTLTEVLQSLGAKGRAAWLDPQGGAEAWLAEGGALVIGAGALAAFGAGEIPFLVALALTLGKKGEALRRPGELEALADAAVTAFDAVPSSLAAARVLARLDGQVRGADPSGLVEHEVLKKSGAFVAVARRAIERLGG